MHSHPNDTQAPSEALLAQALADTATAIFITDRSGKIIWANNAMSQLCGFDVEAMVGAAPSLLNSGEQGNPFYDHLWQTLESGNVWQGEIVDRRKDGSLYTVDEIITPLLDRHGVITHFIAIQHDITRNKEEHEREHRMAYQDFLTGLPNRARFFVFYEDAVAHAASAGQVLATLFIDLDNFKPVNDMLGHGAGDELLVAVAERLRAGVRQADLVARVGGDEFAIVLIDLPDLSMARVLAQKLLEAMAQPFVVQGKRVGISASIGIATFPRDGVTSGVLLNRADAAMYRAKCLGGNNLAFYTPEPNT